MGINEGPLIMTLGIIRRVEEPEKRRNIGYSRLTRNVHDSDTWERDCREPTWGQDGESPQADGKCTHAKRVPRVSSRRGGVTAKHATDQREGGGSYSYQTCTPSIFLTGTCNAKAFHRSKGERVGHAAFFPTCLRLQHFPFK